MAKLEQGNSAYFILDGIPKPRGIFEPIKKDGKIGLMRADGTFLAIGTYDQWTDSQNTSFASESALITFIQNYVMGDISVI